MANQVQQESNIVQGKAADVLSAAYAAGRKVRFWLDGSGNIVGVWQGRNGKTCAVFTFTVKHQGVAGTADRSKVHHGMDLGAAWNNPCKVATIEAMEAYKAEQIALR